MKLLWLSSTPSNYRPEFSAGGYNGVGWVSSAEERISKLKDIELAISFVMSDQPFKIKQGQTTYYPIPNPVRQSSFERMQKLFRYTFNFGITDYEAKIENYYKEFLKKIIKDFCPDVIHVWGSESYMGLVSEITDIPVVLHIQGIINPCMNAFMPPNMSWNQWINKVKSPYSVLLGKMEKQLWVSNSRREKRILKNAAYLLGRTEWDYRVSRLYAPNAIYLHSGEILRNVFYSENKRRLPERMVIVSIISNPPYKGYDLILKTAHILKNEMNLDFEWRCYGDVTPSFIEKNINIIHTDVNVELMGVATAEQLCESLCQSTVYFHPSYMDNSPNSICEAQMLGVPIVATNVGGISSIVRNGVDGYLVPANDPFQAAYCMYELYADEDKNKVFGVEAKKSAESRHDRDEIIGELLENYRNIINRLNSNGFKYNI